MGHGGAQPGPSSPPPAGGDARSDEDLLALVRRGDGGAFEALYARHREFVWRVARRFTGDDDLALDAAQEAFAYLLQRAPTLRLTARLTTFLYPAVKNISLALRERRSRDRDRAGPDALPRRAEQGPSPMVDAAGAERAGALARAVAALPEGQREVLLLRFVDGLSLDEIGHALAIPLGTVKSRLHNALAALRADPALGPFFEA